MKLLIIQGTWLSCFAIILVAILSSGCASYKVPDAEVCVELPSKKAYCTYTLSDDEREIDADDWDKMTVGRFSLSAQDFAKYQSFIANVCVKEKCTKEQKKILQKWKAITDEVLLQVH